MIINKKFRLRWAFEYHLKKPIYGVWDDGSPHISDSAWGKDKTGLKYAVIQGEEIGTWGQYRLLECEADRFVTFKWITAVSMPTGAGPSGRRSFSSSGTIVGLQLLTPENSFTVYVDGSIVKKELTDHDKKFDLREFQTKVI